MLSVAPFSERRLVSTLRRVPDRQILHVSLFVAIVVWALPRTAARADIDQAQYRADLAAMAAPPSRIVGSEGYYRAASYLQSQIAALSGVEVKRHEYPVMVPVTQHASIMLPDGSTQKVYPFWPASVRVCSTPPDGITGRLVYCGTASSEEIRPGQLQGQIAVIEAAAGERWPQAAYFGARAILVLGRDDVSHVDLRHHDVVVPVNIPRFYVPQGALADDLRAGRITGRATVKAAVVWQRKTAVNFYAYVAPRVKRVDGWGQKFPPAALMFSVPYDSSGLVPDLACGAGQAAQAAAGLALLRDAARMPLDRPLLVFFSGADSIQFLGTRNMLMALAESPARYSAELRELAKESADAQRDLKRAGEVADAPHELSVVRDRALMERIVKIVETDAALEQDLLFRLRMKAQQDRTPEVEAEEQRLADRQVLLSTMKYAFSRRPQDLKLPELADPGKRFVRRAIARLGGEVAPGGVQTQGLIQQYADRQKQLTDRVELYRWLAGRVGRNLDPDERDNSQRPIEMIVALDLSSGGVRVGPMFYGQLIRTSNITDIQNYRDWFTRLERASAKGDPDVAWFSGIRSTIDFEPLNQSRAPQSFLAGPMPIGSELAPAWGVPGFSMITLDDLRLARDTPNDTIDRIDVDRILAQLKAVRELFWRAWSDPRFCGPVELKRNRNVVRGQVVSPASGRPVPDLPRDGFLATYFYTQNTSRKVPQVRWLPWTLGVRRNEIRDCDAEGRYVFEALPAINASRANEYVQMALEVFRIDPASGAITACSDLGRQAGDIKLYADLRQDLNPLRSLVFNCEEFTLGGLYDPRFLQSLGEVLMLDARRNAEPQRYNALLFNQLMAGFVEPGSRSYLAFRYGRVGNRLLLLKMPEGGPADLPGESPAARARRMGARGEGIGFTVPELNGLGALSLVTSLDFSRLDEQRLTQYRKAGVSSSLIDDLHRRSTEQIEQAEDSRKAGSADQLILHANGAWANEARVYSAAQDMARDVIRAAIFLLLLCVPFAFCMERLLIGTPNIYGQIAWVALFFAVMTAALWSFHPAFKISSSPLIIILAFAIIFMSIVVISVVYGKFDTELKRIRSGRGVAPTTSFARASVLMSAVLLGIANMRKRKFRTALTSVTVVLITFAVLCFTSAARYLDTTSLPAGVNSSHPGVMLRQRGFRPMPAAALQSLAPVVRATVGERRLVERWWNINAGDPREMVNIVAGGGDQPPRVAALAAALGLSPGESELSSIGEVIGPSFARLENGETNIVYLSKQTAAQLAVQAGDWVTVGGVSVEVAGIINADEFDHYVRTLSGEPLTPLKYTSGALDAGGRRLDDTAIESLDLDAEATAAELGSAYEHLPASQIVIVPAGISRMLHGSSLRSVGIKLNDDAEVKVLSDELAKRYALALFAGFEDGVRMVAASNLASVSGAGQVAIPLAIAGLIIFNTMMGSIAERRREIHVYTSLGLAPMHVGALFVAEALTYGLIGTVFGYIIGQGAGTAMLKLGWLGNVTLNYSGTSAMLTMGLILVIVLLSALVPARIASKIAAPSIERTWRVPLPKGDEILAHLPFTINKTAADGALAYLAEYFDAHQEGSIGKFSAGRIETFTFTDDQGRMSRGLKTIIWLTPFDLGVRQHLMLLIHPGQFPDIYEVQVVLQRLSGDDGSWYRMNRTFLTELRKQFLQWRSLTPQRMLQYVEDSGRLFTGMAEAAVAPA